MLINLPFTKDKKDRPLPYYAVEISDEMVKVAVWQLDEGVVSVIRTSEIIQINGSKMDDYLQAVDMAISTTMIDGETDPKEVLYGLPPEWVDEHGVVAARRSLLKYISEKMQLKPIGFVMIIDALIEYLRIKQSTPPSAIFIRFRKQVLDISLVTLGKIVQSESVGRSNDINADIKEGLMRLKNKGQLPSRIILFDGYLNFADITQQLMVVAWEKEFPFGHVPEIESLAYDITVEAVAVAAGKEAVKKTDSKIEQQPTTKEPLQISSQPIPPVQTGDETSLPEGFAVGINKEEESTQKTLHATDILAAGNVPGQNIDSNTLAVQTLKKEDQSLTIVASDGEGLDTNIESNTKLKISWTAKLKHIINSIPLTKIFHRSPSVPKLDETDSNVDNQIVDTENIIKRKFSWWVWIIGILLILIFLGSSGVWAYINLPKADVRVGIKSQTIEQEVSMSLVKDLEQMDETNLLIPAKLVEASASGSQTVPTTGSKRIGKTASGKITIYNKTNKDKNFNKGTILVGPGNLRYLLDGDVKVASSSTKMSSDNSEIKTYGEVQINISGGDIGEEYNQQAGKEFSFKDYGSDDFSAKSTEAITGGESTEQKAVAKNDLTNAKDLLTQTLEAQATQDLNKNLGNGLIVIDKTQSSQLDKINYDKKSGEASEEITANGAILMSALAVNKNDFDRILLKALNGKIPANYQITAAGLQSQITSVTEIESETNAGKNKKNETQKYSVTVKAQIRILPKLDFTQIKQTLRTKNIQVANDYLKTLPGYDNHSLSISPKLPEFLNMMPSKTERISITIEEINS